MIKTSVPLSFSGRVCSLCQRRTASKLAGYTNSSDAQWIDPLEPRRFLAVDLACASVDITSYDAASGTLGYSVAVSNVGSTDTPPAGVGAIFLSTNQVVNDKDDIQLAVIPASATPRTSQNVLTGTLLIPPSTAAGTYYLGAALDINGLVPEPDNFNNYKFSSSTLSVPDEFNVSISGTSGNDVILVKNNLMGQIEISIDGPGRKETLKYARDRVSSMSFDGLAGNDIIRLATDIDVSVYIIGGDGNDLIDGALGNDTLSGGAGKDTIHGNGSNDRINGNGGADRLFGDTGLDRLFGNAGDDYMDGGSSRDRFDGGDGRDTMYGQGGDDIFTSVDGTIDQLFGGSGADVASADVIDIKNSIIAS